MTNVLEGVWSVPIVLLKVKCRLAQDGEGQANMSAY